MAGRVGNKPLKKKEALVTDERLRCLRCNEEYNSGEFYDSDSELHASTTKIPYCSECLETFYKGYLKKYEVLGYKNADKKAVERMCMILDLYYKDSIFDSAVKNLAKAPETSLFVLYLKAGRLYQYRNKNYDTTIQERLSESKSDPSFFTDEDVRYDEDAKKAVKFFGSGFSKEDYEFLTGQYEDWTTRHECNTKSQEEMFKQICFTQLELLKATRGKQDTKDLNATFLKQLEAAKLQPKQNSGETVSDAQTFGTLIDKWENTRPLPEIDEDLRDVDKIGKYINIFFRGHLSKMMGFKNSFCKAYEDFMAKYSVKKPEYESEEDSEALFDTIFGGDLDD